MGFIGRLSGYLTNDDYRVTILKKGIHIINYVEIVDFSSNRVIVRYKDGITTFNGNDLVISKMMDDELFVTGKLVSVEYN